LVSLVPITLLLLLSCGGEKREANRRFNPDPTHSGGRLDEVATRDSQISAADQALPPEDKIPEQVRKAILRDYPSYQLPTEGDYQEGWKAFQSGDSPPFICSSDFDGDGHTDYAALLHKRKTNQVLLVCFHVTKDSLHTIRLDSLQDESSRLSLMIKVEKKGEWKAIDEERTVPNDGILVEWFNASKSVAYYWSRDHYVKFMFD